MSNYRPQTIEEIRAIVRTAELARSRELSRLLANALQFALAAMKRVFTLRHIAVPE